MCLNILLALLRGRVPLDSNMAGDSEGAKEEYTKDGSVDLNGNPILRSKCGGWTACSFVIGIALIDHLFF